VDACGGALGYEDEVGGVVAFEGFEEVELDGGIGGLKGDDLHAALADLAVPFPLIDGADAAGGAGVGGLHGGVDVRPGRPCVPIMEVVDEPSNLLGRGVDGDGTLDPEGGRLGRSDDQDDHDSDDGQTNDGAYE